MKMNEKLIEKYYWNSRPFLASMTYPKNEKFWNLYEKIKYKPELQTLENLSVQLSSVEENCMDEDYPFTTMAHILEDSHCLRNDSPDVLKIADYFGWTVAHEKADMDRLSEDCMTAEILCLKDSFDQMVCELAARRGNLPKESMDIVLDDGKTVRKSLVSKGLYPKDNDDAVRFLCSDRTSRRLGERLIVEMYCRHEYGDFANDMIAFLDKEADKDDNRQFDYPERDIF
jgi:hypothetical protein